MLSDVETIIWFSKRLGPSSFFSALCKSKLRMPIRQYRKISSTIWLTRIILNGITRLTRPLTSLRKHKKFGDKKMLPLENLFAYGVHRSAKKWVHYLMFETWYHLRLMLNYLPINYFIARNFMNSKNKSSSNLPSFTFNFSIKNLICRQTKKDFIVLWL